VLPFSILERGAVKGGGEVEKESETASFD